MKITKSPLILKDFFIISSQYQFQDAKDEQVNVSKVFDEYAIDFDFMAREQPTGEIFIFVKININDGDKPLPGYSIFAEGVGIFQMEDNHGLSDKVVSDLIYVSGLSIAINNLRNYLSNMTTYFPFGKFLLPSIDVGDLHEAKRTEMKEKEKKTKKK